MLNLYALDIETDTSPGRDRGESAIPAGLDSRFDAIISAAVHDLDANDSLYLAVGETNQSEADLLEELGDWLNRRDPGVLVTWNGANFDLPYICDRFTAAGLDTMGLQIAATWNRPPKYEPLFGHSLGGYHAQWGSHRHIDICFPYRRYAEDNGVRWSLKPVATSLGFEMVQVDATRMELLSPEKLREYNVSDVVGTAKLARRLQRSGEPFEEWLDPLLRDG